MHMLKNNSFNQDLSNFISREDWEIFKMLSVLQ